MPRSTVNFFKGISVFNEISVSGVKLKHLREALRMIAPPETKVIGYTIVNGTLFLHHETGGDMVSLRFGMSLKNVVGFIRSWREFAAYGKKPEGSDNGKVWVRGWKVYTVHDCNAFAAVSPLWMLVPGK